ncbi:MAG: hypothetical protein V1876_01070, partial [Candidatus Peregrinibacteria bacterium]
LITDILSDPTARLAEFGESGPLNFDFPVAAKTGTTRNSRDNWTVGFIPDRIVGVWVGNADNSPMKDTSGVTGAGPIFHDVMLAATRNLPPEPFAQPPSFKKLSVCALSGKLPTEFCPHTIDEWFIAGTEPKEPDDIYQPFLIDTRNGLLAGNGCLPGEAPRSGAKSGGQTFVERKGIAVFPKEVEQWAREHGWPTPPTRVSPLCGAQPPTANPSQGTSTTWLEITVPQPNESYLLDPLIPDTQELIIFSAHASPDIQTVDWYVDGKKVGTAKAPDFRMKWRPNIGRHLVESRSGTLRDSEHLEVVK